MVESLAPGTVRTINTSTPSGIASLSALQLVGLVHQLFSTPTMQDINTVNADLLRPMQNFEDFPDHITEHVNHYDSLASFMQPCANIAKIKTLTRLIFASHIFFSSETKGFGYTARLYLLCFIVPIGHVSKCNASSSDVFQNKLSYAIFRSLELLIIGHRR